MVDVVQFVITRGLVLLVGDLPDLEDIVFGARGHHKPFVQVPREVLDLARMSTMNKNELGRPVALLFFSLLSVTSSQIPDHDAAVQARRCQKVALMPTELHLVDFIAVLS